MLAEISKKELSYDTRCGCVGEGCYSSAVPATYLIQSLAEILKWRHIVRKDQHNFW